MNNMYIVPQAPVQQQRMGYDSNKDVELGYKDIMVGTNYLRVAIVCYNNGSPKISATTGYLRKTDGKIVYNRALKRFTPHELDSVMHASKELIVELNTVVQPVQQQIAPVTQVAPQIQPPVAPVMAQANISPIAVPLPPQMAIPTPVPVQAQMPQIPVAPTIPIVQPTQAETFNSLVAKFNQMNAL